MQLIQNTIQSAFETQHDGGQNPQIIACGILLGNHTLQLLADKFQGDRLFTHVAKHGCNRPTASTLRVSGALAQNRGAGASAVCRWLLDEIEPTPDPPEAPVEVVESLVDCRLADVKLGDIAVQRADPALDSAGAGSKFVELYFDAVEALVDVGKAAAQKVDDLVLGHVWL